MSKYIQVCPHGYTEKCPTCRDGREEQEAAKLLAAKDAEIAALKAELARWKEPLTDEQADDAYDRFEQGGLPLDNILYAQAFDVAVRAIRAAREGE